MGALELHFLHTNLSEYELQLSLNHLVSSLYLTVEGCDVRKRTFAELRRDVAILAAAMKKAGVTQGDRVAGRIGLDFCLVSQIHFVVNNLYIVKISHSVLS